MSQATATKLGVERSTLKSEVKKARKLAAGNGTDFLADPEPWPNPVDGADLLDDIGDAIRKYMVMPDGSADTVALWALFTHCHNAFGVSALLAIHTPTPECGKTTLFAFGKMVSRPLPSSNVTAAVLFRAVENGRRR